MGVVSDVQTYLAAQSLVDGSTGWPSVRRREHDESGHQLVILAEDGGTAPEIPADAGVGSSALKDPGLQIRVRAEPWDSDAALTKAQAIFDLLHGKRDLTLASGARYLRVTALTPEPLFLGFDENGRPSYATSFRMLRAV